MAALKLGARAASVAVIVLVGVLIWQLRTSAGQNARLDRLSYENCRSSNDAKTALRGAIEAAITARVNANSPDAADYTRRERAVERKYLQLRDCQHLYGKERSP